MVHRQGNRRRTRCLATISHSWPQPGNAGPSHREASWLHDREGATCMQDKKASTNKKASTYTHTQPPHVNGVEATAAERRIAAWRDIRAYV